MNSTVQPRRPTTQAAKCLLVVVWVVLLAVGPRMESAQAQDAARPQAAKPEPPLEPAVGSIDAATTPSEPAVVVDEPAVAADDPAVDPVAMAETALAAEEPKEQGRPAPTPTEIDQHSFLDLLLKGGYLMLPIAAMSLLVVTFGLERFLGLRRRRILPPKLLRGLGQLAGQSGGLEPHQAYNLCQRYPSTAARVIRAMLLKVGRPHPEVEQAVREAKEREAARMYSNVRWLGLAAAVAPLLGLLGTVWGMIRAFMSTAQAPSGIHRAADLAEGIYVALVTTFAGLAVAIPAAVLAHLFEGKIQKLFRRLDETLLSLLPQMERFEGKLRVRFGPTEQPHSPQIADRGDGNGDVTAGTVLRSPK